MSIDLYKCNQIANRLIQKGLGNKIRKAYSDSSQIHIDFLSVLDAVIGFTIKGKDESWMSNKALSYG